MSCHFIECFQNQILYFCKTYINILYVSSVILYYIQPAGAWWINFCQGRKQKNRGEGIIATNENSLYKKLYRAK